MSAGATLPAASTGAPTKLSPPPRAWGHSLFSRRLLVVSGKGGVGRTTVAAALAVAAVRQGRRVLLAQVDAHERVASLFGKDGVIGDQIVSMRPGLDVVNMNAQAALREYGLMVLRYEALYRTLFENRPVRSFLSAVPGLDAYSMLGKAWFHTTQMDGPRPRYDTVILDAPASGHATTMLRIPGAILDAMPRGPLTRDARAIADLLADPDRAAFVIVTLAEELPVIETADLARTVRDRLKLPLGPLIVNAMPPDWLANPAFHEVLRAAPRSTGNVDLDATLDGARVLRARRRDAERMIERLQQDPGLPVVVLPRLLAATLGGAHIEQLADGLTGL